MENTVTKHDISQGLRKLGLKSGDKILVHSSLSSIGKVDGGADAVIDSVLEVIGSSGTLVVPTFACAGPVFDPKTSHTGLGIIADKFWQRKGVLRSYHPTHSVAVLGKDAKDYIKCHEDANTAYAEGTPYYKLAMEGGFILLLGVDQDRNTTLHTAEALADLPYLRTVYKKYRKDGKEIEIKIERMAGPHRNFIGFDKIFRDKGVMTIGKIGNAVCRLIKAKEMLNITVELFKKNPSACLCDNPSCKDCLMQKGKIKAEMLKREDFKLSIDMSSTQLESEKLIDELKYQGIKYIQIDSSVGENTLLKKKLSDAEILVSALVLRDNDSIDKCIETAKFFNCKLIIVKYTDMNLIQDLISRTSLNNIELFLENEGKKSEFYDQILKDINNNKIGFAFSPAGFVKCGEKPFSSIFHSRRNIKKFLKQLYIEDAAFDGKDTLTAEGNAEIKELMSILRASSFSGFFALRNKISLTDIRAIGSSFWQIMEEI